MRERYGSIVIGIPTFERRAMVEANAASLRAANLDVGAAVTILVVDDASHEFDAAHLTTIYPAGTIVVRREANSGGADFATHDLLRRCLDLGSDAVLVLDSDMIVAADFIRNGLEALPQTDGCLSLFNTPSHPTLGGDGALVTKPSVGTAGTLWDRDLMAEILVAVAAGPAWDWRFSRHLVETGRRIFACAASRVQHLGFYDGQNAGPSLGDFGVGFPIDGGETASLLFEHVVRGQARVGARMLEIHAEAQQETRRLNEQIGRLEATIEALAARIAQFEHREAERAAAAPPGFAARLQALLFPRRPG